MGEDQLSGNRRYALPEPGVLDQRPHSVAIFGGACGGIDRLSDRPVTFLMYPAIDSVGVGDRSERSRGSSSGRRYHSWKSRPGTCLWLTAASGDVSRERPLTHWAAQTRAGAATGCASVALVVRSEVMPTMAAHTSKGMMGTNNRLSMSSPAAT